MTHGSLFSGIGGFDLAAEWMGWENLFHCEFNPFCQRILKYYWPNSKSYGDITKSTFTEFRGRIDILTGGFPCQPFSTAGKRKGTDDSRYLWPEMLRVIREIQPRYIVGENVRGLVSWDGGLVFDTVCSDLEAEGYEVLPVLLPAAAVNAPHLRQRIFFIAHSVNSGHCTKRGEISKEDRIQEINRQTMDSWEFDGTNLSSEIIAHANHKGGSSGLGDAEFSDSSSGNASDTESNGRNGGECEQRQGVKTNQRKFCEHQTERRNEIRSESERYSENGNASDTERIGLHRQVYEQELEGTRGSELHIRESRNQGNTSNTNNERLQGGQKINRWKKFDIERSGNGINIRTVSTNDDGYSKCNFINFPTVSPICNGDDGLSDRLDSITFPKWRNESIKGGGNAIVPQVVLEIFKVIQKIEENEHRQNSQS
jgi:DNA (cytosine-5)-methyltransferase 1